MAGSYGGSAYGGAAYSPVVAQSSFSGTMPYSIITEIAFASNPLTDPAVWTDVSLYVQSIQTNRGRQHELNRFEAGTATIVLDNKDGRFSPFNTSSPYNPNVLPYKQIRVRALYNGVVYPIFRGHIDAWPVKWPTPNDSVVTIHCVDASKALNLRKATTFGSYSSTIVADTPAFYYRLGEAVGSSSAADSSGNARTAQVLLFTPGAGVFVPAPNSYTSASFGAAGALVADADTAWDTGGFAGAIQLPNFTQSGTGPFSVEAWIKCRTVPPNQVDASIFSMAISPNNMFTLNINYGAGSGGTNVPAGTLRFLSTGGLNFSGTRVLTDNQWHHVVATLASDGKSGSLYVDGIQDGSGTTVTPTTFTGTNVAYFGVADWDGVLDECAFYTTQLSATKVLAHYNAGAFPLSGQTTGQRIGSVLDAIGWPASLRKVDTGFVSVQPGTNDLVNKTGLENLQITADTELGELFIGADGSVVFYNQSKKYQVPTSTSALTLGDSGTIGPGGESPYLLDSVDVQFDDLDIYNEVTVTPTGQGPQIASNATSQTSYGKRTHARSTIHLAGTDAAKTQAQTLVDKYGTPLQRIRQISFQPLSDPTVLLPAAMGFELLTRVTVKRRPKDGQASTFSQDSLIEGITHKITPGYWETTYRLSPTDASPLFIVLDDPIAGQIGGSGVLV